MISIALCTFNGEKYIEKQLLSILNQSVTVDEIVICDDGSIDNTIQIVNNIANKHSHTNFQINVNKKNIGVKLNFEKAIKLCSGDIIFLSDQDDIWFPTKIETILNYFNNYPEKDVVITNGLLIDKDDKIISNKSLFDCVGLNTQFLQKANNDILIDLFIGGNRATGATMAIKKTVNVSFDYKTILLHDYILAIEALARNTFGIIEQPLIYYRIHKEQECGLGDAIKTSWSNNIYDLGYIDFNGYNLPSIFNRKKNMRVKRYQWIAGLRGIISIAMNKRLYKENYPTEWRSFMSIDIKHCIDLFKKRNF